jgi:hypothetical protein
MGSRELRGVLRRLAEAVGELLQLSDPRLQLLDEGLVPEDDLDQFALGGLLQLRAWHGDDPYCDGECERVAYLQRHRVRPIVTQWDARQTLKSCDGGDNTP